MTANEQNNLPHILADHANRYPRMQVQDLYKLLHQATLGSGHAIQDPHATRRWLDEEIADLGAGPHEPLVDPISPDGIVRIHLRPYLQSGADLDILFNAFLRTAARFAGAPEQLPVYGQLATNLAKAGWLPFDPQEIEHFWVEMAGQGFPAVHHSWEFVAAYSPAYRVILWDLLRNKLLLV